MDSRIVSNGWLVYAVPDGYQAVPVLSFSVKQPLETRRAVPQYSMVSSANQSVVHTAYIIHMGILACALFGLYAD